ncbi:hypothetical protein DNTS_007004 [Danionella cerebrum]|uniref:RRM domain-containing protein n=1 Tax=Danionella cerebrum TaxID=2873325 RepID=A0A553RAC2_9TELE|nr:hypothetical protein DNTS_007004 [Danionella translucida]
MEALQVGLELRVSPPPLPAVTDPTLRLHPFPLSITVFVSEPGAAPLLEQGFKFSTIIIILIITLEVTRHGVEEGPIPEEQETEGQRQLHNLLLKQLDTEARLDRCLAKRKCFAPAALYKPFGEQAAGVRSLSQFQALQDGDQELATLRELGLTEAEIQLWMNRDQPESFCKDRGVCVPIEVRNERLQAIREKMAAHAKLLSQPQRFSSSRPLSRREMEIERALFQGTDRCSFLTALYHQEEESVVCQQRATAPNAMDHFYKDFLDDQTKPHSELSGKLPQVEPLTDILHKSPSSVTDQSDCNPISSKDQPSCNEEHSIIQTLAQEKTGRATKMSVSQSVGSLKTSLGHDGPLELSGTIENTSEEEIKKNRESEEALRSIPRFKNYQKGKPSNVLCVKNISARVSLAQLVSLFSRFQKDDAQPLLYRLLTDVESAGAALELLHGYRLLDKPLIIEFGREKSKEMDAQSDGFTDNSSNT